MEWKPIETAPENIPVLIFDGNFICVAIWTNEYENKFASKNSVIYWDAIGASGFECENDFENPTHWMTLPEPPK